jgi:hypothetical protein
VLVEGLEDAGDLALGVAHRDAEDGAGAVARRGVDVAVEAGVGVGVGDVDDLPALGDRAGDALPQLDPDLVGSALGDLAPQLPALAVQDEERAAVGVPPPSPPRR